MLTKQDLESIRAVVREEIERALRTVSVQQDPSEQERREDDWITEYAAATLATMRDEPGSEERMFAAELTKVRHEIEHAADAKTRRRRELWLARLERRGPRKFPKPRTPKPR